MGCTTSSSAPASEGTPSEAPKQVSFQESPVVATGTSDVKSGAKKILVIEVSPNGENSISRGISKEFLTAWKAANADGVVTVRDLDANPVPHLDTEAVYAGYTPADQRSPSAAAKFQFRMDLIAEITVVDEILVSTPLWNWNVPSVLKAYIDQIVVPGVLDGSGASGLAGKKVTIVVSEGGNYTEGARAGWDHGSGYLQTTFGALGSTDVELIVSVFGLAGIVPGMEGLVGKKEESIALAKQAAKTRASGASSA